MGVYQINIDPMGTVRMIRRGRVTSKAVARYVTYKNYLMWEFKKQHKGEPLKGPLHADITFTMKLPKNGKSQSRKVIAGDYVTTKPDIDNMVKGVLDSANTIVFKDDNQVCSVSVNKIYGDVPGIWMEVKQL